MASQPDKSRLEAFLEQHRKDQDTGVVRDFEEYVRMFQDDPEATDREHIALQVAFRDAPDHETVAAGNTLGPYRLDKEIGRGGQGIVYRATDTRVGRRVAVKVLRGLGPGSDKLLAYFRREAAIASKLDHPGLCPVYDAEVARGIPYIAMRYVEGETLAQRITSTREEAVANDWTTMVSLRELDSDVADDPDANGAIEERTSSHSTDRPALMRAILLIEKSARALHAAHQASVIHRDVKPGNVMVTPQGEVVVMDFGLARDDDDANLQTLTQSGDLFGTPAYMSPEQLTRQSLRLDRRTDIWSLGVMLYECVTLRRPFDAATRESLFQNILLKDPPDPRSFNPRLPRDLVTVIQTALEKNRDRRYQTALDLAEELRRIREYEPIKSRPVSSLTRLVRWGQRNPALAAMTGIAALILITGAGVATLLALRANANATQATANAAKANANLTEWERLADGRRLDDRLKEANGPLWPVVPDNVRAYGTWLEKTAALTAKLPEHESALESLRARGTYDAAADRERMAAEHARLEVIPADVAKAEKRAGNAKAAKTKLLQDLAPLEKKKEDDELTRREQRTEDRLRGWIEAADTAIEGAAKEVASLTAERRRLEAMIASPSSWRFADEGNQLRHDKLRDLVAGLQGLLAEASPMTVTAAGITRRLADAAALERRLRADDAAPWRRCIDDLATPDDQYAEAVTLTPIAGLVPLGRDRDSRLWEFWHVASGRRPGWEADVAPPFGKVKLHRDSGAEGIVMVLIPGGTFRMGSMPPDEKHAVGSPNVDDRRFTNEGPVHDVTLLPFLLAKHEVTQGQWMRLSASNGSFYRAGETRDGESFTLRMPVTNVNWEQCREACRRWGLVLPTESRWEYACRARTGTRYFTGDDSVSLKGFANIGCESRAGKYSGTYERHFDDGYANSSPVGALKPNGFGLHDMHGNANEWCLDGSDAGSYGNQEVAPRDGLHTSWRGARYRANRGGSFSFGAIGVRSALRGWDAPDKVLFDLGFRPALSITTF